MSEFDELKKKLAELFGIVRRLIAVYASKASEFLKKSLGNSNRARIIVGVFTITVVFLVLIGSPASGMMGLTNLSPKSNGEGFSFLTAIFKPKITVPGLQNDKTFVFANFESEADLKAWKLVASSVELSKNHAASGAQSAKVTLRDGGDMSAFILDHYFESRGAFRNWSNYAYFRFYIFNPRSETERLLIQIKDRNGKRYKQELFIPGAKGEDFTVPISALSSSINTRQVAQVSIFRWAPKGVREFYFDNIRLVPKDFQETTGVEPKKNLKPSKDRPVKMLDYGFSVRKPAWTAHDPNGKGEMIRIPFVVKNESDVPLGLWPVTGSIPFPMGEIKTDENIRLITPLGADLPFQSHVLAKWPDGSIKWLNLTFSTSLRSQEGSGFFLDYGPGIHRESSPSKLAVEEDSDKIQVSTGVIEAEFSKKSFFLFKRVSLDKNGNNLFDPDEVVLKDAPLTLSFKGEEYRTDLGNRDYQVTIEEKGEQRVVVRASGWFYSKSGKRFSQAIVRYYFYQGKGFVKVAHTLIYTGYPENKYYEKYKDFKLPANEPIESFGIRLPYKFSNSAGEERVQIGEDPGSFKEFSSKGSLELSQLEWEKTSLKKDGTADSFTGIPSGWMSVMDSTQGFLIALKHFRENFPKAFMVDQEHGFIQVDLWPKEAGELDLQTTSNTVGPEDAGRGNAFGLGKTHELFFDFYKGSSQSQDAVDQALAFMKTILIRTNPYWLDATGALGRLYPASDRFSTEEKMLEDLFDWANRHPAEFKWYGMLNFGDTLTWWRKEDEENDYQDFGWHPIGRWGWYNCEGLGTHTGALTQFARTGIFKYFEFGENLARHIMDVDTVHYNTIANDSRLKNVLNDEVSKVGSMHRHSGDHWSGRNEEADHTSVVGLLLYHYLTGDERALDVAKEVGQFFLLKPFTYTGHPDQAPHRAMANVLWGDVLLYELTADERYKKDADSIIEIYLRGQQDDGSFLENYNPLDGTWSGKKHQEYMEQYALGAIMSYHELTQDEEVKEMLLKLIRYLGKASAGESSLHGFSYAYFLTGDPTFIDMANKGLNEILRHKQVSSDPMMNGLIFQKPIYHRPNVFLYDVPYVFEALEARNGESRQ